MSRATRLAAADTRIVPPRGPDGRFLARPDFARSPQLALNRAGIPGALGAEPLTEPFEAAGITWRPADADPWACPIGYTVAVETFGGAR
jgi:hypothetical protein